MCFGTAELLLVIRVCSLCMYFVILLPAEHDDSSRRSSQGNCGSHKDTDLIFWFIYHSCYLPSLSFGLWVLFGLVGCMLQRLIYRVHEVHSQLVSLRRLCYWDYIPGPFKVSLQADYQYSLLRYWKTLQRSRSTSTSPVVSTGVIHLWENIHGKRGNLYFTFTKFKYRRVPLLVVEGARSLF